MAGNDLTWVCCQSPAPHLPGVSHPTAGRRHPLEKHYCAQWVSESSVEGIFRDCWDTPESLPASVWLCELSSPALAIPHFQMFSFASLWGKACWISALARGSAGTAFALLATKLFSSPEHSSGFEPHHHHITTAINIITDIWGNLPNTIWLILITSNMLP